MSLIANRSAILLACALIFALRSPAQLQPAGDSAKPLRDPIATIQVNVNSLLLPVVVRDATGKVIDNLRKEDFKVFDQGKPRPISALTIERSGAVASDVGPSQLSSPGSASTAPSATQPPAPPSRFVVFLFDDRHLSPGDLEQAKQAALRMFDPAAQPIPATDRALVLSFLGVNSGITRDAAVLQAAIQKIKFKNQVLHQTHECPDIDYYTADQILEKHDTLAYDAAFERTTTCGHYPDKAQQTPLQTRAIDTALQTAATRSLEIGEQDARESLVYIRDVVHSMGKLPGQRTLVLVSPGFLSLSQEAMHIQSQIINIAASLNITINTLGARGLYDRGIPASQSGAGSAYSLQTGLLQRDQGDSAKAGEEVLSDLADSSGGKFIHNDNDLLGSLKSLQSAPDCLYLLELPLSNVKPNGAYHALKIEVAQSGLKLQSRKGYFAPPPPQNAK